MSEEYEPIRIQVPYEPYENIEIATLTAIDYLMEKISSRKAQEGVALWVLNKYSNKIVIRTEEG